MGLLVATRTYNVPIQSLSRCVAGVVNWVSQATVLTKEEESQLEMNITTVDMGLN